MANEGLSNRFLHRYLKPKCKKFKGVFAVDRCPKPETLPQTFSLIVNLSEAHLPGSHFVAVYADESDYLWYFDSFAFPPPVYNRHLMLFLAKWIRKNRIIHAVKWRIQSFESLFCGWFAASFCLFVELYMPPTKIGSFFESKNLIQNEANVRHLVKALCRKIYALK